MSAGTHMHREVRTKVLVSLIHLVAFFYRVGNSTA